MYDSFDMACHDASSALRLNIKVNSENLLPNAHKYNVGSLRLPADPSWPKIPQRRLADDIDGIIEPPCVVTFTGTPRKSRTTVRPHFHQSPKASYSKDQVPASFQHTHHKVPPTTHPLKRRPGCADPRFKRVTTVKSEVTSNDPPERENHHTELSRSAVIIPNQTQSPNENVTKTIPEKDTDPPKTTEQEVEKSEEIREMGSIGVQTMPTEESLKKDEPKNNAIEAEVSTVDFQSKKILDDAAETKHHEISPRETGDSKILEQDSTEEKKALIDSKSCEDHCDGEATLPQQVHCSKEEYSMSNLTTNIPVNVQSESTTLQYCQGNAGPFFLVVEKKAQAPSLSALQIDPSPVPSCQYTTQCYNVQVPVLTYQNLPLQISTQPPTNVDAPSQLSLSPVLTIPSTPSFKNPAADISFDKSAYSQISDVPNMKIQPEQSTPLGTVEELKTVVPIFDSTEKSTAQTQNAEVHSEMITDNCNLSSKQESSDKYLVSSDAADQQARKTLGTPPIKLERKNDDNNYKFEDIRIHHQLPSDTTDSELYSIEAKENKPNVGRFYSKETSCSGSDCDQHFHQQSKFKNDLSQLKKKRRKSGYCSTEMSEEVVCSRSNQQHCERTPEFSTDDRELIERRENCKQMPRSQRKMKSEQNLSRYLPFPRRNYKNISDPHLALRESYRVDEETFYASSYPNTRRKRENSYQKEISDKCYKQQIIDKTTDVESDVINEAAFCDFHPTDVSINEESEKPADNMLPDKPAALPAKTQQLLSKSYMEYYDKLRTNNIDKSESFQERDVCQMAKETLPQLNKRRAESQSQISKIVQRKASVPEDLTLAKLSALSNIINRNLLV